MNFGIKLIGIIYPDIRNYLKTLFGKFQDRVNWDAISINQTLSEDFIREFQDRVNWNLISLGQILSEDFKNEFKDKLNLEL